VQEARTLAYFEAKGEPFEKETVYQAPGQVDEDDATTKSEKKAGVYGHLPPHHPAAQQAMNVAKRQQMKDREDAQLQKKCEKRLTRGPMWKELEHSSEFPGPGKKLAMRGPFKRYMDAQRHGVTCDAGMPKWWEIAPLDPSHGTAEGEAVCIKFKKKFLRGEGGENSSMTVLPPPCADQWKAIHKGVGKFLLMNEEGLFVRCDKDGSLSMAECNPEDINSFRPFVWEMKFK